MTHDIRKLITGIRAWERSVAAFEATSEPGFIRNVAWMQMSKASKKVTGRDHSTRALAAFVALADAYEAQAAALRAIADAPDSSDAYAELLKRMALEALTGNDEGDA
jgi:hypothetical protein